MMKVTETVNAGETIYLNMVRVNLLWITASVNLHLNFFSDKN